MDVLSTPHIKIYCLEENILALLHLNDIGTAYTV